MRKYVSLSILSAVLVASAVALGDGSGPISGHVQTLIHFEGNDGGLHVIKPNDPLPVSESNSVTTASPKPTLVEYRSAVGSFCSIPDAGDAGCGTTLYDAGPVVVTPTSPLPTLEYAMAQDGGPIAVQASLAGTKKALCVGNDGTNEQTMRVNGYGGVATYEALNAPSTEYPVSLSANVASGQCGLTAGALYLISCDADSVYHASSANDGGTPYTPAVSTNTRRRAGTERNIRLLTGQACIALLSSSSTTCVISLIPVGP